MVGEQIDTVAFKEEFSKKYPDKPISFKNGNIIFIDHSGAIPKSLDTFVDNLKRKHVLDVSADKW